MTRISTFCVLSGALAALGLFANNAIAGSLAIHPSTTTVNVPMPKAVVHTPTPGGTTGNSAALNASKTGTLKWGSNAGSIENRPQETFKLEYGETVKQYQSQTTGAGGTKLKNGSYRRY